jgi:hypothetical protein
MENLFKNNDHGDLNLSIIPPISKNWERQRNPLAPTAEEIEYDTVLNYREFANIFDNLYENKIIYHYRFTAICMIDKFTITPERFLVKVHPHLIVRNKAYGVRTGRWRIPDKWSFGSVWWVVNEFNGKYGGYGYLFWTNPDLVRRVETLVLNKENEKAFSQLMD